MFPFNYKKDEVKPRYKKNSYSHGEAFKEIVEIMSRFVKTHSLQVQKISELKFIILRPKYLINFAIFFNTKIILLYLKGPEASGRKCQSSNFTGDTKNI